MTGMRSRRGQPLANAGALLAAIIIAALLAPVVHPTEVAPAPTHSPTAQPAEDES